MHAWQLHYKNLRGRHLPSLVTTLSFWKWALSSRRLTSGWCEPPLDFGSQLGLLSLSARGTRRLWRVRHISDDVAVLELLETTERGYNKSELTSEPASVYFWTWQKSCILGERKQKHSRSSSCSTALGSIIHTDADCTLVSKQLRFQIEGYIQHFNMTVEATIITIRNKLITSNPTITKWLVESWQAKGSWLCKHRSLRHNTGVFVTIHSL